ncbi:MAG TPA: ABC transporter permease [Pyrodictium sp.]|nr:ABC transporter permease [Pyrodictium sp.]
MNIELLIPVLLAATGPSAVLVLAAVGEILTEKSGVVNIGIEGMMLISGLAAAVTTHYTGSPWLGVLAAMCVGCILGLIHGAASAKLKANQIVLGIGLNMFAVGLAVAVLIAVWGNPGHSSPLPRIPALNVGGYSFNPFFLLAVGASIAAHYILTRTGLGLTIASCGENPRSAEAMGVRVELVQTLVTGLAGLLHGLAGAILVLGYVGSFTRDITAGRGFVALAIVVVSNWNPLAALVAGYLFGTAEVLALTLQAAYSTTPGISELLNTIPYIAAIAAVALYGVKARAPSWLGKPYIKE